MAHHRPIRVLIAGGGIGGLTVAHTMTRALGRRVKIDIYERFPSLQFHHGPRFMLAPNGLRILRHIGIPKCDTEITMNEFVWHRKDNSELGRGDLTFLWKKHGLGLTTLLRNEILGKLSDGLPEQVTVHLNEEVSDVQHDMRSVRIRTLDGTEAEGDILIGADGINSGVRTQCLGFLRPTYSGHSMYRGQTPLEQVPWEHERTPGVFHQSWGDGKYFGRQVTAGDLHWFFVLPTDNPADESWEDRTDMDNHIDNCIKASEGWAEPVPFLTNNCDELLKVGLFYREPLSPAWHNGRVVLLGDAAHAVLPYTAQGANQAIEDAWCLAKLCELSNVRATSPFDEWDALFAAYYAKRHRIAAMILRNGIENSKIELSTNPLVVFAREQLIGRLGPKRIQVIDKAFLSQTLD